VGIGRPASGSRACFRPRSRTRAFVSRRSGGGPARGRVPGGRSGPLRGDHPVTRNTRRVPLSSARCTTSIGSWSMTVPSSSVLGSLVSAYGGQEPLARSPDFASAGTDRRGDPRGSSPRCKARPARRVTPDGFATVSVVAPKADVWVPRSSDVRAQRLRGVPVVGAQRDESSCGSRPGRRRSCRSAPGVSTRSSSSTALFHSSSLPSSVSWALPFSPDYGSNTPTSPSIAPTAQAQPHVGSARTNVTPPGPQ